nr:hypothetical protein [Tanacetum cinerariifolium]
MLSMEKQLKFLNEIVYKRSQSIQTIHMMAPKVPTYNGRPTFANPRYLKQAQSEIPCLYAFPYDQSTHANRLILDGEETLALERESQSKLNKDLVRIGPNWMFHIDTLTMSMNYQPVFTRNQTNGNACTKANIDAGQARKKTIPGPRYVLLPLLTYDSQGPKSSEDEVADDAGKKKRAQRNEFKSVFGQDKDANGNRMFTPVSVVGSTYVNLGGSIPVNATTLSNVDLPTDPLMPDLKDTADLQDTRIFSGAYDDEVEGVKADFKNLELTIVMDVKSAFLYDTIEKEVYVCQPSGFKDPHFSNKVYKVEKALYGLHQALRACQDKYVVDKLKKFDFSSVKTTSALIETNKALLKDEEADDMDVHLYKSMIGSLMYLTAFRPDIMFVVCACASDS